VEEKKSIKMFRNYTNIWRLNNIHLSEE
jgi:hypothetical protein